MAIASKNSLKKCPQKGMESFPKEKRLKHGEDTLIQKGQVFEEPSLSSSARKGLSMAMWPVASERCIVFNFLEELGLQLEDKIEKQGWTHFCSLNTSTYPNSLFSGIFWEEKISYIKHEVFLNFIKVSCWKLIKRNISEHLISTISNPPNFEISPPHFNMGRAVFSFETK